MRKMAIGIIAFISIGMINAEFSHDGAMGAIAALAIVAFLRSLPEEK
jgi:hypothetical protein